METIDKTSAQHIGRSHQSIGDNLAKMMGLATVRLLEALAHRLNRQLTKVVEVKINDKLVFRGKAGEKPEINKFSPEHIKALESLLSTAKMQPQKSNKASLQKTQSEVQPTNMPQTANDLESIVASAKAQIQPEKINELLISVGGQSVYHSKDGNELVNQLVTTPLQASKNASLQIQSPQGNKQNEQFGVNSNFNQQQLKQNVNHLSIVAAANRILEVKGVDKFEDKSYSIERSENNLVVTAKDGRGEIAKVDSAGQVSGKDLLPGEPGVFRQAVNKLEFQLVSTNISPQALRKEEEVNTPLEEKEQIKTVAKPKIQVVTASKSQPDEELKV